MCTNLLLCLAFSGLVAQAADVKSLLDRARAYEKAEDYTGAERTYQEALTLAPDDPEILKRFGVLEQTELKFQDSIELFDQTTSYEGTPVLLRNAGNGGFVNVSDLAGEGMKVKMVGRGVALDDLDNDGRIDVVVLNSRRPPAILRNESKTGNHWLHLQLRGVKTNREGVGARVKVVAGDLVQFDEVHAGRGYQGHFGARLHFGLGPHDRVDRIEVRWIGGGTDCFESFRADQIVTLVEGTGIP